MKKKLNTYGQELMEILLKEYVEYKFNANELLKDFL